MLTKQEFISQITHEINTIKHLYTKIPAGSMDWRPLEDMRSARELLQYLAFIGYGHIELYTKQSASPEEALANVRARGTTAKDLKVEDFPAAMDKELALFVTSVSEIPDEEYATRKATDFSGAKVLIPEGLLNSLKTFVAYRHQLFLYARMNGAKINTVNNWRGKDPEPVVKKEPAAQTA